MSNAMLNPKYAFEDFPPGTRLTFGAHRVSEDDVIAFAREFDPQPFHLDRSRPGGVIASGWHTCAMTMRLVYDSIIADSTSAGAPGVEETQWLRPVRPGMVLSATYDIDGARVSRSRPELGFVHTVTTVADQTGEPVMRQRNWIMFGRRDPRAPIPADQSPAWERPSPPAEPPAHDDEAINRTRFATTYEDIVIGARVALGSYEFSRERLLRFARAHDPQPFHLDDEAAARSHFGRLAASGWHTAAAYMRCFVDTRDRLRDEARQRGADSSAGRPSPGFTDLRWTRPVFVDDTVSFETTILGKRPSSKPGFGKTFTRARGYNQAGQLVYEYHGVGLAPIRG